MNDQIFSHAQNYEQPFKKAGGMLSIHALVVKYSHYNFHYNSHQEPTESSNPGPWLADNQ